MKEYNFQEQLNDTRQKEGLTLIKKHLLSLGEEIINVSENSDYFKRGVDLIRVLPDSEEFIDVKTDFQAHESGNIPVELIEVCSANNSQQVKLGWIYQNIHEVIYYIYYSKKMIKINKERLKELTFSEPRKGYASFHRRPFNYFTLGVLVPITSDMYYE